MEKQKSKRGFASMDPTLQKELAARGGKSVSQNHDHMVTIGRKGGIASGLKRKKPIQ